MTEDTEALILEQLGAVRAEMVDQRDLKRDILKRLIRLETMMEPVSRDIAKLAAERVEHRHGIDSLRERIARIEHRMELAD